MATGPETTGATRIPFPNRTTSVVPESHPECWPSPAHRSLSLAVVSVRIAASLASLPDPLPLLPPRKGAGGSEPSGRALRGIVPRTQCGLSRRTLRAHRPLCLTGASRRGAVPRYLPARFVVSHLRNPRSPAVPDVVPASQSLPVRPLPKGAACSGAVPVWL